MNRRINQLDDARIEEAGFVSSPEFEAYRARISQTSILPNPAYNPIRFLEDHQHMNFYEDEEDDDGERMVNSLKCSRKSIMDDALNASMSDTFITNIKYPLVVMIKEEIGVDLGALKRHVLSTLLDLFENGIGITQNYYENPSLKNEDNNCITEDFIKNRLYCFGLFSGIAVVQCSLCPKFILDWTLTLIQDATHPFIQGLNVLGVAKLIKDTPSVRAVFVDEEVSAELLSSMFVLDSAGSKGFFKVASAASFLHFKKFLLELSEGNVRGSSGPITMKQIFQYVTGSWLVPRVKRTVIRVKFWEDEDKQQNLPSAATCTGVLTLPLTASVSEMISSWIIVFDFDGGLVFNIA